MFKMFFSKILLVLFQSLSLAQANCLFVKASHLSRDVFCHLQKYFMIKVSH